MTNRSTLINMLLLAVLTGIILVSGSIQCAVECLTRNDQYQGSAIRVDDCHYVISQTSETEQCLNKACHRSGPAHGSLDGPEVSSLQKLAQPLASASSQLTPEFRAGSAIEQPRPEQDPRLALVSSDTQPPSQQQRSLRTTVLLN